MLSLISAKRLREISDATQRLAADFRELRSTILPRLQHLESELLSTKLDRFFEELHPAIELAIRQGVEASEAVEKGLRAAVSALPRGKAGGVARAQTAWRYSDGTFMPESERAASIEEFELAEYERYAAGGRARAKTAARNGDGTFV